MSEQLRPMCPHCKETFETLGVWTDELKYTAIFFCPKCRAAFGAQILPQGLASQQPGFVQRRNK